MSKKVSNDNIFNTGCIIKNTFNNFTIKSQWNVRFWFLNTLHLFEIEMHVQRWLNLPLFSYQTINAFILSKIRFIQVNRHQGTGFKTVLHQNQTCAILKKHINLITKYICRTKFSSLSKILALTWWKKEFVGQKFAFASRSFVNFVRWIFIQ